MKLWTFIGAEVWAPTTCECAGYDCESDPPNYGPHRIYGPDQTGHKPHVSEKSQPGRWTLIECECGWTDLDINYWQHLHEEAPRVAIYS